MHRVRGRRERRDQPRGGYHLAPAVCGQDRGLEPHLHYCAGAQGCPWASFTLAQTARRLEGDPRLASRVRFVSLSFDPARDTPEAMARYGRSFSHDPDWAFVTTRSPEALAPILADYDQRLRTDEGPAGGWSHLLRVFLIDEAPFVRNIYSSSFLDPVLLGNDIATLGLDRDQDVACTRSRK